MRIEGLTTEEKQDSLLRKDTSILENKKQEISISGKNQELVKSIVNKLDLNKQDELVMFGNEAALEISRMSDQILKQMESVDIEGSSRMLTSIEKIMKKFDPQDFGEDKHKNLIGKIFSVGKKSIDELLKKYNTMTDEVEKITIEIRKYELEIRKSNETLERLLKENLRYYENLQNYVLAGEICLKHINEVLIPEMESKKETIEWESQDILKLNDLYQSSRTLEQRVYDLKLAGNIAMQNMPTLKFTQESNNNLIAKYNSAFIITLPVFKGCLINAMNLKRQKIHTDTASGFDKATAKMLKMNGENVAKQSVEIAKLASTPSIKAEDLMANWNNIVRGIEETKRVQEEAKQSRKEGEQVIAMIKDDFNKRFVL